MFSKQVLRIKKIILMDHSLRTQTYFRLSLVPAGREKRQPEIHLRLRAKWTIKKSNHQTFRIDRRHISRLGQTKAYCYSVKEIC